MSAILYDREGNSATFDAADFDEAGHQESITRYDITDERFIIALQGSALNASAAFIANATDSVTIGTGSKAFTIEQNKPYFVGAFTRIEEDGNSANFMEGDVTAYNPDTGALTVNVVRTGGSGTIADWKFYTLGKAGNFALTGLSFRYAFDTTTTAADPGSGNLRANNADLTAATKLFIDDEQADGVDVSTALLTFDDSTSTVKGYLQLVNRFDSAQFVIYQVDGLTDQAGYVELDVTHIDGSGTAPFPNTVEINIGFVRTGDQGDAGDVVGPVSSTDNALARWDGAGGSAIQNSGWTLSDTDELNGGGGPAYNVPVRLNNIGTTASTVTVDLSSYNVVEFEPTADLTVDITNLSASNRAIAWLKITGGGDHTLTFDVPQTGGAFLWDSGSAPALSTGTDTDVIVLIQTGADEISAKRGIEAPA